MYDKIGHVTIKSSKNFDKYCTIDRVEEELLPNKHERRRHVSEARYYRLALEEWW